MLSSVVMMITSLSATSSLEVPKVAFDFRGYVSSMERWAAELMTGIKLDNLPEVNYQ